MNHVESRHDVFLTWLTERGHGSWDVAAEALEWLFSEPDAVRPWMTMEGLSALGHVDIDWETRQWTVSPPVLNFLAPGGRLSVLCGARPAAMVRRLRAVYEGEDEVDLLVEPISNTAAPTTWVLAGSRSQVSDFGHALGASVADDAAMWIATRLPSIRASLPPATGVRGGGRAVRRFNPSRLAFNVVQQVSGTGLFEVTTVAGKRFTYVPLEGVFHDVDRSIGIYAELARVGYSVIKYQGGELVTPTFAQPPLAHRRALVLSSGVPPVQTARQIRYRDVPRAIAERVATSLGQNLAVVGPRRQVR